MADRARARFARFKRRLLRPWTDSQPSRAPTEAEAEAKTQRFRAIAREADLARDARDWLTASIRYAEALALDNHQPLRVQYGHTLKEMGRLLEAEEAYREVVGALPDDAEVCLHLGHVRKLQRRPEAAIEAYLEALRRDPTLTSARDEVIAAGGRDRLSTDVYGRSATAARLARLSTALDAALTEVREGASFSAFPVTAYDAFRRQYPIQPPPAASCRVLVLIDAAGATPSALRLTLTSLQDQRSQDWRAVVVADKVTADHPVASAASIDARIGFYEPERAAIEATLEDDPLALVLAVPAGALLDTEAVGWFAAAATRTPITALYADHDHFDFDWRTGPVRFQPAFQSMPDRHDIASSPQPPAAIAIAPALRTALLDNVLSDAPAIEKRRALLLSAIASGPVAHLPRVLVGLALSDAISDAAAQPLQPASNSTARILVVIPTRDEAELLERCIQTLTSHATQPDLLDILVVDNRSVQPETQAALERLRSDGRIEVSVMDTPFNWAHLNNEAVHGGQQEILIFANNDMEMLTRGWDEQVRIWLSQADVGVVGARLLYPDGGLQHGGILLGGWQQRPSHDGLWVDGAEGGPLGRWRRSRAAAAVTGAFMACRRETFDRVGGFNPRLAIAYNDIDFCLRTREAGLTVIYAANIEMVHYESRTRGHNDAPEKVAWDDAELADMYRRWGNALAFDPGLNPHWASAVNRPYDGYRDPPLSQILKHLDHSARPRPWTLESAPQNPV